MWALDHKKGLNTEKTDALELWSWRRLFRVPWTTRRSNQSILKEISPEYSLEELMLLNCGVGEDSRVPWTTRRSNQLILKEISSEYSLEGLMLKLKLQYLATWCEGLTHRKNPWCWERLKEGREGDNRGWYDWMASPTQRTWVWVNSGSCLWTGRPGMLRFMGSQRVRHDWVTELNWTEPRKSW